MFSKQNNSLAKVMRMILGIVCFLMPWSAVLEGSLPHENFKSTIAGKVTDGL